MTDSRRLFVLVVDDNRRFSAQLAEMLEEMQLVVVGPAHDGHTALELFRECLPQVVILDLNLPDQYGLDVLRQLRAHPIKCSIIVLTTDSQTSTREQCLAEGADHFLVKGRELAHLETVISGCISQLSGSQGD